MIESKSRNERKVENRRRGIRWGTDELELVNAYLYVLDVHIPGTYFGRKETRDGS